MEYTMLDVALGCITRGWYVFPCKPKAKEPAIKGGFHSAVNDEATVREWWAKNPNANVGVATGKSGLTVLDIDAGVDNWGDVDSFCESRGIPDDTYTVRTGRRPGFGVQLYFKGEGVKSVAWCDDTEGVSGDIRGNTGYVMAAGSIHPSGERYTAEGADYFAPVPEYVRQLRAVHYGGATGGKNAPVEDDGGPITMARNNTMVALLGRFRAEGNDDDAVEAEAHRINDERMSPPLGETELDRLIQNACKWAIPEVEPDIVLGGKVIGVPEPVPEPVDWRLLFHTREETENTPDPKFLLRDFLQEDSVTGIIGPARARKSIISLNIIHALLTGEPLFGRFDVTNKPERVIYLCPESGKTSLAKRIRNLGLAKYVGETFFYSSMNSDPMKLVDPQLRTAAKGSVLFIDTAIRFFEGDENDAGDMKVMGAQCQALIREGARAVVLLHHTAKNAEKITLESGRGSGDFGGFLTCCWGTTLDDYDDAYRAQSLMACVKQRDFQADKFKLAASGDPNNFFLRYVETDDQVVVSAKAEGNKRKTEQAAKAAKKLYDDDPGISAHALRVALLKLKLGKGADWCRDTLMGLNGTGVTLN